MRISIVCLLWVLPMMLLSGDLSKQQIKNSPDYYTGSGVSRNEQEAMDHALEELTKQIAVKVSSSFERKFTEAGDELQDKVNSVLKTHANATLKNVQFVKEMKDGQIHVFCYIHKDEVKKIYNERKKLVFEMYTRARAYEAENNFAHALKMYYFGALLLNSIPETNIVYNNFNLTTAIPDNINKIVANTRFYYTTDNLIADNEREITLKAEVYHRPAALLDFTFWDGSSQVAVQARDGLATFRLLGASIKFKELDLNIKYSYYECRKEFPVIEDLWNVVTRPEFKTGKKVRLSAQPVVRKSNFNYRFNLRNGSDCPVISTIHGELEKLLTLVQKGKTGKISTAYADDPFLQKKVSAYVKLNHPKVLDKNIIAALNKTHEGYEVRRVRMLHKYPTINKQTTEYLVADFNEQGKLTDLNTAINENTYNRFVEEAAFGKDWGNRQIIIKFLELYRTAYLTRNIKTVNLMFADEALIIVGRKIEPKRVNKDMVKFEKLGNEPDIEYIRLSKEQYLTRLQRVFKAQTDILLDYGSCKIIKKGNAPGVYGVEMRQNYYSTTYSDEGYLFLLIDFNETDPLIYVRAWQPNEFSDSSLVKTANFRIYK